MYKIKIFSVGKTKEHWLIEALEEYTKRLKPYMHIEWILTKNGEQLQAALIKETHYLCLDPEGISLSSQEFSTFIHEQLVKLGSRLSFVIGGAEGFPREVRSQASGFLSLSPLTFTHQLTRLILLEQLYRAVEIQKGSSYHK